MMRLGRELWGALAIAVLAAGCSAGGGPARYAPADVPADVSLCGAFEVTSNADIPQPEGPETTTVWGDTSLPDAWRGPLAIVLEHPGDAFFGHEGARPVTVGGHPADVAPMPLFQGVSSSDWGHVVTWHTTPARVVEVALRDGSADQAVRLAGRLRFVAGHPRLPHDALGAGTRPLHVTGPEPPDLAGTWHILYGGSGPRLVTVAGAPTGADDLELTRLYAISSQATEIDGLPGVRFASFDRAKGPFGVTWHTADGQTITVTGGGIPRAGVASIVRSMRRISGDEWSRILAGARAVPEGCFPAT